MNINVVPKIPNRATRRSWSKELRNAPGASQAPTIQATQNYLQKTDPNWAVKQRVRQSAKNAQDYVQQLRQQWYAEHPGQEPPKTEEKDYIKEFGDSQQEKNIPIKYEPPEEWGFEKDIQHTPVKEPTSPDDDKAVSFATEITNEELKEMVTEAVLDMMNTVDSPPSSTELLEEQKEEIEGIIKEYCNRPGIMSISFREDFEKDISQVNALIDPTNRNNWIALREELIYKLPYSYKESLHTFASQIWNKHKFV